MPALDQTQADQVVALSREACELLDKAWAIVREQTADDQDLGRLFGSIEGARKKIFDLAPLAVVVTHRYPTPRRAELMMHRDEIIAAGQGLRTLLDEYALCQQSLQAFFERTVRRQQLKFRYHQQLRERWRRVCQIMDGLDSRGHTKRLSKGAPSSQENRENVRLLERTMDLQVSALNLCERDEERHEILKELYSDCRQSDRHMRPLLERAEETSRIAQLLANDN